MSDTDWNRESGMGVEPPTSEVPVPSPTSEEPAMKTKEFSGEEPAAITAQQSGEDIAQTPRETTSSDFGHAHSGTFFSKHSPGRGFACGFFR